MEAGNKENGKRDINRKALQFTQGTASRAGYDISRSPFKTEKNADKSAKRYEENKHKVRQK